MVCTGIMLLRLLVLFGAVAMAAGQSLNNTGVLSASSAGAASLRLA